MAENRERVFISEADQYLCSYAVIVWRPFLIPEHVKEEKR